MYFSVALYEGNKYLLNNPYPKDTKDGYGKQKEKTFIIEWEGAGVATNH